MIRKIRFSNFCSFLEETVIDFTAAEKTSTDDSFVPLSDGSKLSLTTGVFGANAAGKTNLLKVVSFLNFWLKDSYQHLSPKSSIPLDQFGGVSVETKESWFEIEFEGGDERYLYEMRVRPQQVESEMLRQYNAETKQYRQVLKRELYRKGEEATVVVKAYQNFTQVTSLLQNTLKGRPNCSIIAAGLQTGASEFHSILASLGQIITNVSRLGKQEQPFEHFTKDLFTCAEYFQKHPAQQEPLRELLCAADLGIMDFQIKEIFRKGEDSETEQSYYFFFVHQGVGGKTFMLPANQESSGTKRLLLLFHAFIEALETGGMVAIDEMESDLHPHLIPTLLEIFNIPENNPNQAQLFFTCHHVEILNQLLKEQIMLVSKDKETSQSRVTRLDKVKGVRREENFLGNYNAGHYGATPKPEMLLL